MSNNIVITANSTDNVALSSVNSSGDTSYALRDIGKYFLDGSNGAVRGGGLTCTINSNNVVAASDAFTITSSNLSANDTVTIGITTFTAKSSGASGAQFNIGASALVTAQNLAALINSYSTTKYVVSAVATAGTSSSGVCTVTCLIPGTIGNMITVGKSSTNGSWSGTSALTGGTDGTVVTLSNGL